MLENCKYMLLVFSGEITKSCIILFGEQLCIKRELTVTIVQFLVPYCKTFYRITFISSSLLFKQGSNVVVAANSQGTIKVMILVNSSCASPVFVMITVKCSLSFPERYLCCCFCRFSSWCRTMILDMSKYI